MPIPPSPIPPGDLARITNALQQQAVATLAAAIIVASGRPHSIQQALEITRNIHFAMHPSPNLGAYIEWEKTKDATLNKIHGA